MPTQSSANRAVPQPVWRALRPVPLGTRRSRAGAGQWSGGAGVGAGVGEWAVWICRRDAQEHNDQELSFASEGP